MLRGNSGSGLEALRCAFCWPAVLTGGLVCGSGLYHHLSLELIRPFWGRADSALLRERPWQALPASLLLPTCTAQRLPNLIGLWVVTMTQGNWSECSQRTEGHISSARISASTADEIGGKSHTDSLMRSMKTVRIYSRELRKHQGLIFDNVIWVPAHFLQDEFKAFLQLSEGCTYSLKYSETLREGYEHQTLLCADGYRFFQILQLQWIKPDIWNTSHHGGSVFRQRRVINVLGDTRPLTWREHGVLR